MAGGSDLGLGRRKFIGSLAGLGAAATIGATPESAGSGAAPREAAMRSASVAQAGLGSVTFTPDGNRLRIDTGLAEATFDSGVLTDFHSKASGIALLAPNRHPAASLELVYPNGETVPVSGDIYGSVELRMTGSSQAEFRFSAWNGDGVLAISVDPESRDLLIEPSAYSSRPGVRACRWHLGAIDGSYRIIAPFFQGVRLPLQDSLLAGSHWSWPMQWEAGLVILEGPSGGFWVHCRDDRYRYKALQIGGGDRTGCLGFDSEAYGPIDQNLSAGGLCWRLNTFSGDWKEPAGAYRDWLWQSYGLKSEENRRKAWIHEVGLALSWCPTDPAILDALSTRFPPPQTLLHLPDWRTDPYDENYPTYEPSDRAKSFLAKAARMGFRVMPHFNSVDMDPTNPVYARIRDFQYRTLEKKDIWGWAWKDGRTLGVPESNQTRTRHRDKKVMVKVHPGLSTWRSILAERIDSAARGLSLETVFIDVTLTTGNLYNCLVEGMTSSEGMSRLIRQVGDQAGGLSVGGEGLNEITFQGLSFAQAHLFRSWHESIDGLERTGDCPLNDFLFSRLCRTIGYSGLDGENETSRLRYRIHKEHNAIPTITVRSADEILHPNPGIRAAFADAAERP